MDRRAFLAGLASVVATPLATHAQPAGRPHRIGVLALPPREVMAPFIEPFAEGLRQLGYVDGRDFVIEYRVADWKRWRLPGLAKELVQLGVDVILTGTNPITDVAKRATTTIPIVMVLGSDPVRQGLVDSLARPVGNVTGLAFDAAAETYAKPFQFLREAIPQISRVAVVWNPDLWSRDLSGPLQRIADESTAKMAIGVQYLKFAGPADLKPVFDAMRAGRARAALVWTDPINYAARREIASRALAEKVALASVTREFAEAGALMTYGPAISDLFRRAAVYVDKILKGAKPVDLPVEQPTKIELVINLKTAKALGLTIPSSLLLRADQVIQ